MLELNYQHIMIRYEEFLKYAFRTSTTFSLIFQTRYPHSRFQVKYCDEELAEKFEPYLKKQWFKADGIKKCLSKHDVLNIYQCSKATRNLFLSEVDNIFSGNIELPEDVCFYRNDEIWFDSVIHEKVAVIYNYNNDDINFLTNQKIDYARR